MLTANSEALNTNNSSVVFRCGIILIACNVMYWLTRSCVRPALPLLLYNEYSADTLGLLLSLQALLPIFFSLCAGSLGDRYGHVRVLNVGAVAAVIASVIYLIVFTLDVSSLAKLICLSVAIVLSGMAWLLFWVAIQSLATIIPEAYESKFTTHGMIHWISLTMSLGLILGPIFTGVALDFITAESFWVIQFFLSLLHAILCYLLTKMLPIENISRAQFAGKGLSLGFKQIWEHRSSVGGRPYLGVLFASLLLIFCADLSVTFLPAQLGAVGVDSSSIGLIVIAGPVCGAVFRLALAAGWFSLSTFTSLIVALGACLLGVLSLGFVNPGMGWIFCSLLLGIGVGLGEPTCLSITAKLAQPHCRGLALSGRVLANRIGMFLAPILAFQFFSIFGNRFGALGLLCVFLIPVFMSILMMKELYLDRKESSIAESH